MADQKKWQEKLSCFSPNFVVHEVAGDPLHFYPVSVGMAFKLRVVGKPLAKSLAVLFGNKEQDHGTRDVTVHNEYGSEDRQIIIEPITEGLAKIRHSQRTESIEKLVESLTDDGNAAIVGEIIMDSLRDVFPKGDPHRPPASEFINQMPLPVLGAMIMGLVQANKEVFGPLTEQVAAAASAAMSRIGAAEVPEETETVEGKAEVVPEPLEVTQPISG
jgi:hypothetical protein